MQMFLIIMTIVVSVQVIGLLLFITTVFNSEEMILYDSLLLSVLSVGIVVHITLLSGKIKNVLGTLEAVNQRNSQPQIRRIYAIIVVANIFFVSRVILEVTLSVCLIILMKGRKERSCGYIRTSLTFMCVYHS